MKKIITSIITVLLIQTIGFCTPEPAIIQKPGLWTTHVAYEPLRLIRYQDKHYWYMIMTVTNHSGGDIEVHPQCDLVTDQLHLILEGKHVPNDVVQYLLQLHQRRYPLLEHLRMSGYRMFNGEDHAKDILLVWPDVCPMANQIRLYLTGLSNEVHAIDHPFAMDEKGQPEKILVRKCLELTYNLTGAANQRNNANIHFKEQHWVMR